MLRNLNDGGVCLRVWVCVDECVDLFAPMYQLINAIEIEDVPFGEKFLTAWASMCERSMCVFAFEWSIVMLFALSKQRPHTNATAKCVIALDRQRFDTQ